jgi:hypothetical protein
MPAMPAVVAGSMLCDLLKELMGALGLKAAAAGGARKEHQTQRNMKLAAEFSDNSPESTHILQFGGPSGNTALM